MRALAALGACFVGLLVSLGAASQLSTCDQCRESLPFFVQDESLCEAQCSMWPDKFGRSCVELCSHLRNYVHLSHQSPCHSLGVCTTLVDFKDSEAWKGRMGALEMELTKSNDRVDALTQELLAIKTLLNKEKEEIQKEHHATEKLRVALAAKFHELKAMATNVTQRDCVKFVNISVELDEIEHYYIPTLLSLQFREIVWIGFVWCLASFVFATLYATQETHLIVFDIGRSLLLILAAAVATDSRVILFLLSLGLDRSVISEIPLINESEGVLYAESLPVLQTILIGLSAGNIVVNMVSILWALQASNDQHLIWKLSRFGVDLMKSFYFLICVLSAAPSAFSFSGALIIAFELTPLMVNIIQLLQKSTALRQYWFLEMVLRGFTSWEELRLVMMSVSIVAGFLVFSLFGVVAASAAVIYLMLLVRLGLDVALYLKIVLF